jgi:hypothetical protein
VRSPPLLQLVIIGASFGYVEAGALCASSERRRRQALRRTPAAIDLELMARVGAIAIAAVEQGRLGLGSPSPRPPVYALGTRL